MRNGRYYVVKASGDLSAVPESARRQVCHAWQTAYRLARRAARAHGVPVDVYACDGRGLFQGMATFARGQDGVPVRTR